MQIFIIMKYGIPIEIIAKNDSELTTESGYEMKGDSSGTTSKPSKTENEPNQGEDDKFEGSGVLEPYYSEFD